nr:vgr related protein [uncultured Sphingomonas sp.]
MRERPPATPRHRPLSPGETAMLRGVFGEGIDYARVRIHPRKWWFVFPGNRPMAPNGHAYFPGETHVPDFAAPGVPLWRKASFVHEGTHLYQWYGLKQWVWVRGPFQRNYDYRLEPGKPFTAYGLEQMGMIAQHYFTLANGGRIPLPYTLADYAPLLPLT